MNSKKKSKKIDTKIFKEIMANVPDLEKYIDKISIINSQERENKKRNPNYQRLSWINICDQNCPSYLVNRKGEWKGFISMFKKSKRDYAEERETLLAASKVEIQIVIKPKKVSKTKTKSMTTNVIEKVERYGSAIKESFFGKQLELGF